MRTEISFFGASARNRVLVIIGVIALSLWMIYPIQDSLKLGLDLNGGVQLVLRVKTDDRCCCRRRLPRNGCARRSPRHGWRFPRSKSPVRRSFAPTASVMNRR